MTATVAGAVITYTPIPDDDPEPQWIREVSMARTAVCPQPGCPNLRPCPTHSGSHTGWSSNRDRAAQARFRAAVLARDGHRCTNCGAATNLRACHIRPISQGGGYHPTNGVTRCQACDRLTDPFAR